MNFQEYTEKLTKQFNHKGIKLKAQKLIKKNNRVQDNKDMDNK